MILNEKQKERVLQLYTNDPPSTYKDMLEHRNEDWQILKGTSDCDETFEYAFYIKGINYCLDSFTGHFVRDILYKIKDDSDDMHITYELQYAMDDAELSKTFKDLPSVHKFINKNLEKDCIYWIINEISSNNKDKRTETMIECWAL